MSDYADSKGAHGTVFPDGGDHNTQQSWDRSAALITPEQLRLKHCFGIPLVSAMRDPITQKNMVMTDPMIEEMIDDAAARIELETGITVFPQQFTEKPAFDSHEYNSFMYFRTKHRPVMSIEMINVTPSNEIDIFEIPIDWVETGNLHQGQINVIPMTIALNKQGGIATTASANGGAFLQIFGYRNWIPAFWKIKYTAGFPSGKVPKVVNDLIGVVASMEILSMLAATNAKSQGSSLSIDGLSQSVSTPGPEVYTRRLKDLAEKRHMLTKKLKSWAGVTLFTSNV
jgi:hypothetical protein